MCYMYQIKVIYKESTVIKIYFIKHKKQTNKNKTSELPQSFKRAVRFEYLEAV